jgi:predicted oxidoreductase (fatty acid repression mutant protein)
MAKSLNTAIEERRTLYALDEKVTVSDERIIELIKNAVQHVPSAFNSQSSRVIILIGDKHKKLWDIALNTLKAIVPADSFPDTEAKINSFAAAYGSVLYFDDTSVTNGFAAQFPLYKEKFLEWAQHSNGMLQFAVWTSLEAEGLGANLQHYNPLIDDGVKEAFDVPASWHLIAQMPFGNPIAPAGAKEFVPIEDRVKILK